MTAARSLVAIAIGAALSLAGARAEACAACGCGDQTLTATGIEKPYKNRVRLALEERGDHDAIEQEDSEDHEDQDSDVFFAFAEDH